MADRATCVGVFRSREQADEAIKDLRALGIDRHAISVVARGKEGVDRFGGWDDKGDYRSYHDDDNVSAGEGAVAGGITGLLIGAGLMLIPGIGPIFAVGPLAAGLAGAVTGGVTGAVTGGIAGGLIDLGVPDDDAQYYERSISEGAFLVTVDCGEYGEDVRRILLRHGAEDVAARDRAGDGDRPDHDRDRTLNAMDATAGATSATSNWETPTARHGTSDEAIELREEELVPHKERVEASQVEIHKDVVTENRTIEVPVTREEVVVERLPVGERTAAEPIRGDGEVISMPVHEEQVSVEKRPVVTEEVAIGTRSRAETEHVSDTVRREEAVVERSGDVSVNDEAGFGGTWDEVSPRFRSDWERRYGNQGGSWTDYEPGYRYGWELGNRPDYQGRSWSEIEPDARRDWEARHHDKPWDRFADSIRDAWGSLRGDHGGDAGHSGYARR